MGITSPVDADSAIPLLLPPGSYSLLALHLGSSFNLSRANSKLGGTLARAGAYLVLRRTHAIIFLFPYGSLVFLPLSKQPINEAEIREFKEFVRHRHDEIRDEYIIEVNPSEKERVEFSKVYLPEPTLEKVALVAQLMAQSNSLEHYEDVADQLTEDSADFMDTMAQGQRPVDGPQTLKFIGEGLAVRHGLLAHLSVMDSPEETWEDKSLDILYQALRNNFEIQQRMRATEYKLELVKETAHVVVSLNESRRSHFLELVIIFLIAFEIVLYLIGH